MFDTLIVDLLRPSGALHTIVVESASQGGHLVVAGIVDVGPPDAAGPVPVDVGSLRLVDAETVDVKLFHSRPRQFARRASSSMYDVEIAHAGMPAREGVYYLGLPPEWCVCSVEVAGTLRGEARRAWSGLHSHADDSSWIECPLSSAPASAESLAICLSLDSDSARGVSPLPEFGVLHHRHAPIEILRAAGSPPGVYGVKIDLKAGVRSPSRGA